MKAVSKRTGSVFTGKLAGFMVKKKLATKVKVNKPKQIHDENKEEPVKRGRPAKINK